MQQIVEKLSPERNFIDNAEFARIMGISKRTAQTWRDEKRISFSQVGAKIYYRREDVEQLLLQNLTSAIPKEK
jgi:excisionase family DNA binding protein